MAERAGLVCVKNVTDCLEPYIKFSRIYCLLGTPFLILSIMGHFDVMVGSKEGHQEWFKLYCCPIRTRIPWHHSVTADPTGWRDFVVYKIINLGTSMCLRLIFFSWICNRQPLLDVRGGKPLGSSRNDGIPHEHNLGTVMISNLLRHVTSHVLTEGLKR